jgi:N-acyl amino acid synthase of PEP-CTERM/exosortase system
VVASSVLHLVHNMLSKSLNSLFFDEFKVYVATTPAQKDEAYRVRYKVYCEELQYESAQNFPNQMERDNYDQQSIHVLVQHRKSGNNIGCVRLIFSKTQSQLLPFQKTYGSEFSKDIIDLNHLHYSSICEVSRLAVISNFRKGSGNFISATDNITNIFDLKSNRRSFPLVPLSLYLAICSILVETDVDHLFTMMEPRLCRHLRRVGFEFNQIGHLINYHGKRAPFYISQAELIRDLDPGFWSLRERIHEDIKADLKLLYAPATQYRASMCQV